MRVPCSALLEIIFFNFSYMRISNMPPKNLNDFFKFSFITDGPETNEYPDNIGVWDLQSNTRMKLKISDIPLFIASLQNFYQTSLKQ